ncbi:MAG: hypothetical protein AAGD00_00310 [Planctomycetota bacterium]
MRHATLAIATTVALAAAMGGCQNPQPAMLTSFLGHELIAPGPLAATGMFIIANSDYGPTVSFRNESDVPIEVRYWIGRIDQTAPTGVTDWRTPLSPVAIAPGEKAFNSVGISGWVTRAADGVVRAEVRVEGRDMPVWFELGGPPPYQVRALGEDALRIAFEPVREESSLASVPVRERFAGNYGRYPVENEAFSLDTMNQHNRAD